MAWGPGVSFRHDRELVYSCGMLTQYMALLRAGPESLGSFSLFPFGERNLQPLSFLPLIDSKELSPKVAYRHTREESSVDEGCHTSPPPPTRGTSTPEKPFLMSMAA